MTNDTTSDPDFSRLLEYLKVSRDFDFSGYKPASLMRRLNRRMQQAGCGNYADYLDHLEVHPDEFTDLFNTILINVTAFFRDSPAWGYLSNEIVPRIIENSNQSDGTIRVWSAGCASGEEAYTVGMILAEALGTQEFSKRVRIYATDLDEDALGKARHATYTSREVRGVPEELQEKYFTSTDSGLAFRSDLRRSIIFGRHNLIQDAPISRLDFLVCRNTLMYFNSETQDQIMRRLHFALKNTGLLFLGKAEMLISHARLFSPVSLEHRMFSKISVPLDDERFFPLPKIAAGAPIGHQTVVREAAFESGVVAEFLVSSDGELLAVNLEARDLLGLTPAAVGQHISNLEIYSRPIELAPLIAQANSEGRTVLVEEVRYQSPDGGTIQLELRIIPLFDSQGIIMGASVAFVDVTGSQLDRYALESSQLELQTTNEELQTTNEELATTNEELETTNEELQTTNEELQTANEEMETSNEEIHSTNEELETSNEELQSTNEEMETMNEELGATNEELQTMNDLLQQRSNDLADVNEYLDSILASLQSGIAVLGPDLVIRNWNAKSQDLWGVNRSEAEGRSIVALEIGLPVERLVEPINNCLRREGETQRIVVEAVNRRGRTIQCQVTCSPMTTPQGDVNGVILMMEEQDGTEPAAR